MNKLKKAKGGARPGAGMPKGHKTRKTLEKDAERRALQQAVFAQMEQLVDAQISNALGINYLVVRNKVTGKFVRIAEAAAKTKSALQNDEEIIEVWEKDPSVQAFTDLMNRTLGKPVEAVEMEHSGGLTIRHELADSIDRAISEGRQRAARRVIDVKEEK